MDCFLDYFNYNNWGHNMGSFDLDIAGHIFNIIKISKKR